MNVRFVVASITTLAVFAGFALGRVTAPQAAMAQVVSPPHFMCYRTKISSGASGAAQVIDQFGSVDRKFSGGDMICAPAKKKPFFNPRSVPGRPDHLVCYHTQGAYVNVHRKFANQFDASEFNGLTPRYFCIPTFKYPG